MGVETFDREGKRDVHDETDKIIQAAMEEERREKRKRVLEYQQQGGVGKAALLTDSDEDDDDALRGGRRKAARVEDDSDDSEGEEGRPHLKEERTHEQDTGTQIQEGLVAIAQKKRAAQRRGNVSNVEDTGLVGNIEQAEEQYDADQMRKEDMEKEHGIELEAFNLVEERKRGYFDKEGNYMEEGEEQDDDEEADAWLDAGEEKQVVDEATRRRIEEEMMMAQQDEPTKMTAIDIARVQYKVAKILRPEETVASALKRLGGGPRQGHGRKAVTKMDDENRALFDSLTECATILMDAGEIDVYSKDKRYFQSAASVYIDVDETGGIMTQSKAAYADADEDMFADDSEGEDKEKDKIGLESSAKFMEWPVKELKRFLAEHGKSCDGITEKSDLVALAVEISEGINAQKGVDPPAGYVYDPTSGYYWSSESKLYFDPASAGYFNPISREWYRWNGTTWIPWKH